MRFLQYHAEDGLAKRRGREGKEGVEVAAELLGQHVNEVLEALRLEAEVAGRADYLAQPIDVDGFQRCGVEQPFTLEVRDGPFDVLPVGVLRQDGTDHNLKRRLGRPPALWAERREHRPVKRLDLLGGRHRCFPPRSRSIESVAGRGQRATQNLKSQI